MDKKILGAFVAVFVVVMLATPVIAKPTHGQKVPVTLYFLGAESKPIEVKETGVVVHRHGLVNWTLMLDFQNGTTCMGEAILTDRHVLTVPQKDVFKIIMRESYEMWFPSAGGGFEGSSIIMMDNVGNPPELKGRAHALLIGTGAFEGQTINVGHPWGQSSLPLHWDGYLLKP